MPYTTVVAATTITAAWGNANVRDQVVTPFTDSAARASAITSPVAGMVSVLTTTKRIDTYNGTGWSTVVDPVWGAWTTYTPTFTQSATITKTVNYASYQRVGRKIEFGFHLTASSSGTAANVVQVGLPVLTLSTYPNDLILGGSCVQDISVSNYITQLGVRSTSAVGFIHTNGYVGVNPNIAIVSGDIVSGSGCYEANTDA